MSKASKSFDKVYSLILDEYLGLSKKQAEKFRNLLTDEMIEWAIQVEEILSE